jgi:DNA polymerase-3 subunit gamma/tau
MSFVVSARKYRPTNFDELIGQDHIATTLKNALRNGQLAHAFLFSGPRGVGKTTSARILAKVLNCENKVDQVHACGNCSACKAFSDNASFNIFELDAASNNSVEHIRALNDQVRFQPQQGSYKIYIIDEVHMLTQAAFNAFLKTLEEPPPYAKFILATTEKHKIIPTILSRCQIFDFRRIQVKDIVVQLQAIAKKENRQIDDEALHLVAQKADGAMRDALSIYDKVTSSTVGDIDYKSVAENLNVLDHDYYFQIVDAAIKEDLSSLMVTVDDIFKKGFEAEQFILGLMQHLRQLLFVKDVQTAALLEIGAALKKRFEDQAQLATSSFLMTSLVILERTDMDLIRSQNKRLSVEIALSKMAYMNRAVEKKKLSRSETSPIQPSSPQMQPTVDSATTAKSTQTVKSDKPSVVSAGPETATSGSTAPEPQEQSDKSETAAASAVPPQKSPTPSPAKSKNSLRLTPKLNTNIDDIVAGIHKREAELEAVNIAFDVDTIRGVLNKWKEATTSPSFRSALDTCKIVLKDNKVQVLTPSDIYKDLIKQEMKMVEEIYAMYPKLDLVFEFKVDKSAFPDYEPPKKVRLFSTIEKYDKFKSQNPNFEKLVQEFKLKPLS